MFVIESLEEKLSVISATPKLHAWNIIVRKPVTNSSFSLQVNKFTDFRLDVVGHNNTTVWIV